MLYRNIQKDKMLQMAGEYTKKSGENIVFQKKMYIFAPLLHLFSVKQTKNLRLWIRRI